MYVGNVVACGTLILSGSTVDSLPSEFTELDDVTCAHIDVEGGSIRFFVDGTTPTPLLGHPILEDASITLVGATNVRQFAAVAQDAGLGGKLTWSIGTGAAL